MNCARLQVSGATLFLILYGQSVRSRVRPAARLPILPACLPQFSPLCNDLYLYVEFHNVVIALNAYVLSNFPQFISNYTIINNEYYYSRTVSHSFLQVRRAQCRSATIEQMMMKQAELNMVETLKLPFISMYIFPL